MSTIRIPLVGSYNERGLQGMTAETALQDQRFLNCIFSVYTNPVTQQSEVYVEKRPGWGTDTVVASGNPGTALIKPQAMSQNISSFGTTNSTIYYSNQSVGVITGVSLYMTETLVSNVSYVMIRSSDGTGWYYADGAKDTTTYTGDTHTNTTIDNLGSTAGMYVGQKISGSGITAGTRIAAVNSSTAITTDTATTATASGVTITKEPIAKIISANFVTTGSYISGFAEMDGYLFYSSDDGKLWNSDLNSVTNYTATSFVSPSMSPDKPVGVAKHKNVIICFATGSIEFFYNAGNATGSPLQRLAQYFTRKGALSQTSVAILEDDIFFVGGSTYGDLQVFVLSDLTPRKISESWVDKIIGNISASGGTIYVSAFQMGGMPYLLLTLSTTTVVANTDLLLLESGDNILLENSDNILLEGNGTSSASFATQLAYNARLKIWGEWDAMQATFVTGQGGGGNNKIIASSRFNTTGKVYAINPVSDGQLYQDDGVTFSCQIRTARMDWGSGMRKYIKEIRLIADTQSTGTVLLEKSDDDYQTWQTLGTFDLTQAKKNISRGGSHLDGRAYRLTHTANAPFRAQAIEFDYYVGST